MSEFCKINTFQVKEEHHKLNSKCLYEFFNKFINSIFQRIPKKRLLLPKWGPQH